MLLASILNDFLRLLEPVKNFFIGIWNAFRNFCLQYISSAVFNIFIFGILILIVLFILLAIINKN